MYCYEALTKQLTLDKYWYKWIYRLDATVILILQFSANHNRLSPVTIALETHLYGFNLSEYS